MKSVNQLLEMCIWEEGKSTKQIFIKPAWLYKLAVRLWVNLIACLKQYVIQNMMDQGKVN